MSIRPLQDRVVIARTEAEQTTAAGIVLPGSKEKPEMGEVLAVGPGKATETGQLITMNVQKGDKVYFGKYAGTEIKIDGKELLVVREEDILGVVG